MSAAIDWERIALDLAAMGLPELVKLGRMAFDAIESRSPADAAVTAIEAAADVAEAAKFGTP